MGRENLTTTFGVFLFIEHLDIHLNTAQNVTSHFVTFSLLSMFMASIFLSFILGYLNSIEPVRRGILLYIYKDVITIFLFIQWTWCAIVFICFITGNGVVVNTTMAKIMSYAFTFFLLQFLFFLNILSIFKLYMTKEMILDPPLPWEDEENRDPKAVAKIRVTCVSLGLLIILIMVASEGYPKFYYSMIGDYERMKGWPIGSTILLVLYVILTSTYAIITVVTEVYQTRNVGFTTEPTFLQQFQIIPRMFLIVVSMVLYCYLYYNMFRNGQLWLVTQLLLTVTGVLSPTFIITNTVPLKIFVHHVLENAANHLSQSFETNIFRSSRIEPLN